MERFGSLTAWALLVVCCVIPAPSVGAEEALPDSRLLIDFAQQTPESGNGARIEKSNEHATSGQGLKMVMPPDKYGWMDCWAKSPWWDWSGYEFLAVDVYNPANSVVQMGATIRDAVGKGDYADRYNGSIDLNPGMNNVKIPMAAMMVQNGARRLDFSQIKSWAFSGPAGSTLFFSNVRLATRVVPGLSLLPLIDCDNGKMPNDSSARVLMTDLHLHPAVSRGLKCIISKPGVTLSSWGSRAVPRIWSGYERFRFRAWQPGPQPMEVDLHFKDGQRGRSVQKITIEPGKDVDIDIALKDLNGLKSLDAMEHWTLRFDQAWPQPLYLSYFRLVKGDESKKQYTPAPRNAQDEAAAKLFGEATAAAEALSRKITEARTAGIDTAYYEIYPVIAEVALDYRWLVPSCMPQRAENAAFVIEHCRRATGELSEVMAGQRKALSVPLPPQTQSLKAEGRHFSDGQRKRVLTRAQDGVPGDNPLFTGSKFYIGTMSASGASRYDVRTAPIFEVYQKNPETHRVGFDGFCGHFISDAASDGGGGTQVVICLESPLTLGAITEYMKKTSASFLEKEKDVPAHSVSWEALYGCYCERTRDMFRKFVAQRHQSIEALNKAWGTQYASFDAVEMPHHSKIAQARAQWYDFGDFNCQRFSKHYAWTKTQLDALDPRKDRLLMGAGPAFAFYGNIGFLGVDIELMHSTLDRGALLNESGGRLALTDLLKSIAARDEMVLDVEFHGTQAPLIMGHLLHGVAAIDWCEWLTSSGSYAGLRAIPFNSRFTLQYIDNFLRQILDARRLEAEIIAFDDAPREVALMYSRTSLLQTAPEFVRAERNPYTTELLNAYAGAQATGVALRFLTVRQLAAGKLDQTKVLLVPGVCYETPETVAAVMKFVENGGTVLMTPDSWMFDQYNRPADYLGQLGVKVLGTHKPQLDKQVVSDINREGGFLQGTTEEVRFGELRSDIKVVGELFADRPETLQGNGVIQDLELFGPAKAIALFDDAKPAMAAIAHGKGRIIYIATSLTPASMTKVLDRILPAANINRPITARLADGTLPLDFECRSIRAGERTLVYVMNLSAQARTITLSVPANVTLKNLSLNRDEQATLSVPGKEVFILEVLPAR